MSNAVAQRLWKGREAAFPVIRRLVHIAYICGLNKLGFTRGDRFAIGCRTHEGQTRRNRRPRSIQQHYGESRGPGAGNLRSRDGRRDFWLVGQAGAVAREEPRSSTYMADGLTWERPSVPQLRRPHRFESRRRRFHTRLSACSRKSVSCCC